MDVLRAFAAVSATLGLDSALTTVWLLIAACAVSLLLLTLGARVKLFSAVSPETRARRGVVKKRRRAKLGGDAAVNRSEFILLIGRTPFDFYARASVYAVLFGIVTTMISSGSWGLGLVAAGCVLVVARMRANHTIEGSKRAILDTELHGISRAIENDLSKGSGGLGVAEALRRAISGRDTRLTRSLQRALSNSRSTELGLRSEASTADFESVREFMSLLADGCATGTQQNVSVTIMALTRSGQVLAKKRSAFRQASTIISQARGTRSFMLLLMPLVGALTLGKAGDNFLATEAGNIVVLVAAGLIVAGIYVSDLMLRRALKDF
jgi:hypothetical protein